jgi:Ras family protein
MIVTSSIPQARLVTAGMLLAEYSLISQDEYSILNNKHAIGIHGYILVYSVASRVSFDMIQVFFSILVTFRDRSKRCLTGQIIHEKILTYSGTQGIPCVIVGQKNDLVQARQVLRLH